MKPRRVLFVCHGNICRSPMAEYVLRDMVQTLGREGEFVIDSAATSCEELGNPVYPPARRSLSEYGIDCSGKTARRVTARDYERFDLLIGMDEENMRELRRRFSPDREGKLHLLLDFTDRRGEDISDPWYTRDFRRCMEDIRLGCLGLLDTLLGTEVVLDLSGCTSREELYAVLRREMLWEPYYGENADAVYDILTGLPHRGRSFRLIMPADGSSEAGLCARKVGRAFAAAGCLAEEA